MKGFSMGFILLVLAAAIMLAGCMGKESEPQVSDAVPVPETPGLSPSDIPDDQESQPIESRVANLTRFVENAAAYAREKGKEAALAEFNNPNGSFVRGSMYIFAYDMNGTTLTLPYQRELLGTNRSGFCDSNGVPVIERMVELQGEGGGSLYYTYLNPGDNYRDEVKVSVVRPVDSQWFVGSGIYLPGYSARFDNSQREDLIRYVQTAAEFAKPEGREKAIAVFNDRNGTFTNKSRYIFAYDYNGTTLVLPYQPEFIDTNRMNFTDTYGIRCIGWMLPQARKGGGASYIHYYNPETREAGLKLCYVEGIDDTWYIGSGIYGKRI
jgi:signal transduction histidine kinase